MGRANRDRERRLTVWPWDHVAVAYLCWSLYVRVRGRGPQSTAVAVAVVAAALAPDLIDKPLAWVLGVLPSGRSLGHSLFTALAAAGLAAGVGRLRGISGLGTAVAIGWVSHLLGDVAYPLVVSGDLAVGFMLWPLVPAASSSPPTDAIGHVSELFAAFLGYVATPAGAAYLLADAALIAAAIGLWVADGAPGTELPRRLLGRE
ncbi:metal-dependent hydrolase (plasmid) [Halobaculum sp. CBA1158]|uniref:metal-dependent hydrolase n=1 Tax=Halobaculum sp. CBA1158 TaxID=2904243 RepID=UPI001F2AFCAD|nr:metal-dependent hydrolase [Halobaculum sp. CBA1158]UIP01540.1 metal-dependent hydrolase [Halobaculum sp. CBA1158]